MGPKNRIHLDRLLWPYHPHRLAKILGVNPKVIHSWKAGESRPTHGELSHLCDVARVRPDQIIYPPQVATVIIESSEKISESG